MRQIALTIGDGHTAVTLIYQLQQRPDTRILPQCLPIPTSCRQNQQTIFGYILKGVFRQGAIRFNTHALTAIHQFIKQTHDFNQQPCLTKFMDEINHF